MEDNHIVIWLLKRIVVVVNRLAFFCTSSTLSSLSKREKRQNGLFVIPSEGVCAVPEKEYVNAPTGIPGVELRFEKGQEVDVPRAVARVFYLACLDYARAKKRAEIAAWKLKAMRPEVLKHANAIPGLAGVRSEPNDFSLLVVGQQ